jgi:hypothetical protein
MSTLSELFKGIGAVDAEDNLFKNPVVSQMIAGIISSTPGISVTPPDETAKPQVRDVASTVDQGMPYTPSAAQPQDVAPKNINNASPVPAKQSRGLSETVYDFGRALQGHAVDVNKYDNQNETVALFMQHGLDEATARAAARNPAVQQALLGSLIPQKPTPYDLKPGEIRFDGKNREVARNDLGRPGANELGLNPQYVRGPDGKVRLLQVGKDGRGVLTKIDEGLEVLPPTTTVDRGTSTEIIGRHGGGSVGNLTKDVEGEARGKKYGQEKGEALANKPQATAALDSSIKGLERLEREAQAIHDNPALGRITGVMGMFPNMPGGEAANVKANLETLKSQVGFSVLQAMRDASKTGGALGAISDRENEILQNNLSALMQSQSVEQFQTNLQKIVTFARESRDRLRKAYGDTYGNDNDAASVVDKARQAIADGANREAVIQRLISNGINPPPGL